MDGKRKCIDSLEQTIETLCKIKKDLSSADKQMPDTNVVQLLWSGDDNKTFTKEEIVKGLELMYSHQGSSALPVPLIIAVSMQDNYILDANRFLKPIRMCFIKFSTDEDVCIALGLKEMRYTEGSQGFTAHFILPTQTSSTRDYYRSIGKLVTRLGEIDNELTKIGAVREYGTNPKLGSGFVDKSIVLDALVKMKAVLAIGYSLDHHMYALLASMRPVDTSAVNARLKTLYDEECNILIQLREFQLSGGDFEFKMHGAFM